MIEFLKGKKTYLVAAAMVVLSGLKAMKYIDESTFNWISMVLMSGGFVTIKAGQARMEENITKKTCVVVRGRRRWRLGRDDNRNHLGKYKLRFLIFLGIQKG
jgi:hypothetical protein